MHTMKVLSTSALALLAGSSSREAAAFAPSAPGASIPGRICADGRSCSAGGSSTRVFAKIPFFAQAEEEEEEVASPVVVAAPVAPVAPPAPPASEDAVIAEALEAAGKRRAEESELDGLSMEDEVELLVQKELGKTKRMSNLRNEKGVEYAPWMGISAVEEDKIRSLMRERTASRRMRQEQERDVSGNLFRDSQAQELSGTGLSYKIINGEVELQWATKTESNTKGFIVKRRAAKTNDYSVVASHRDYGPLQSKGKTGGVYRYLDDTASPGGWVYRISEEDDMGNEADCCQCLVEVETDEEQRGAIFAAVGFAVFAAAITYAGITLDPMNGN